jgi:hypothetical protein
MSPRWNFLFIILFFTIPVLRLQAQSSATSNATATIVSANTINITEQRDTSFTYSTILSSVISSSQHLTTTPSRLYSFRVANINGEASSAFSVTIPPAITLSHAVKASKIKLETVIKRQSNSALSKTDNIQINCCLSLKTPLTTGLYTSAPFDVIINYN